MRPGRIKTVKTSRLSGKTIQKWSQSSFIAITLHELSGHRLHQYQYDILSDKWRIGIYCPGNRRYIRK